MMISQGLLWLVVIALAAAVLALTRQIGVLHERLAPIGALALGQGPQPGDVAPTMQATTLADGVLTIGGTQRDGALQLLLFVSPVCPICRTLIPTAKSFAETEVVDLVLVGDGDADEHRQMANRYGISLERFINGPEVGRSYHVGKLPYAVLISNAGIVISQGLVNSREHLESLVVAHETGLRSIQEYVTQKRRATHV